MLHRPHEGPPRPSEEPKVGEDESSTPQAEDYLSGERIVPRRIAPEMTVADLMDSAFQAYNAGRLNEAARLYANACSTLSRTSPSA